MFCALMLWMPGGWSIVDFYYFFWVHKFKQTQYNKYMKTTSAFYCFLKFLFLRHIRQQTNFPKWTILLIYFCFHIFCCAICVAIWRVRVCHYIYMSPIYLCMQNTCSHESHMLFKWIWLSHGMKSHVILKFGMRAARFQWKVKKEEEKEEK